MTRPHNDPVGSVPGELGKGESPPDVLADKRPARDRGWFAPVRTALSAASPYGVLLAFALAIGAFSALSPGIFPTVANFRAIFINQSILVVVALGVTVPLICGQFDLSLSQNISTVGLVTTGLMSRSSVPWLVAVAVGLLVGVVIGLVNGTIVAYGRVHSFIATLATGTLLTGFVLWYSGGASIFTGIPTEFSNMMRGSLLGLPLPIIYTAIGTGVVAFVLAQTPFGRYLYAIGGNRSAAEVAGVPVKRHVLYSLVVSGTLAGIAGLMLASRSASAQPGAGDTYLLPAFAAAFIGAATFRRGEFNALGTVVGVYLLATLVSGAFILGAQDYVNFLITGTVLIVAVLGNRALVSRG